MSGYRVSVITAVINDKDGLEKTLASVTAQSYENVEIIVIDGGSTDGTLDVLTTYSDRISYWISETDDGIADAMNKGVEQAAGDLVLFLHADDHFPESTTLASAVRHVTSLESIWAFDILHGNGQRLSTLSPRAFNRWVWFKNPLPHQGVLCPRALFTKIGLFDSTYKIDMDYEFWLRAYRAKTPLVRVSMVLAIMNDGGVSSRRDWIGLAARFKEERAVQVQHADGCAWRWIYVLYWPLYLGYRRLRVALEKLR